jgi:signal transduction histidine kinase/ligand-binding sensor domain-containing protein/DNA-binding response OmpR family regulator
MDNSTKNSSLGRLAISGFLLLLAFISFVLPGAHGQSMKVDFSTLASSENLSQNTIQCIYQDVYGFIWFGTQDGLNKYDGYQIEIFKSRSKNPNSLPANHITALAEDADHNLWIGTRTGGISRLNRSTNVFTNFKNEPHDTNSIDGNQINVIFRDSRSRLWIGTQHGLNLLDTRTGKFKRIHFLDSGKGADREVRAIVEDRDQNLWIATRTSLKYLAKKTGNILSYNADISDDQNISFNSLALDANQNIWVGTHAGLLLFDKKNHNYIPYPVEPDRNSAGGLNPVYCLLPDKNRLWIGSNTTLQLFDTEQRKIIPINEQTEGRSLMPNDGIYALFNDKADVLWIGTSSQGVLKKDKNLSIFPSLKASLTNMPTAKNIIRSLAEDKQGNLYLATDAGLAYFDRSDLTYKVFQHDRQNVNSISSNYTTWVIYGKKDNKVWIGTSASGLDRFDPATKTFTHFVRGDGDAQLSSNAIDVLLEDRAGNIWIGTDEGGINVYHPATRSFTRYLHSHAANSLCDNTILALYEDKKGNIWAGGYSNGISILNPATNSWSQLNMKNSALTSNVVSSFYEDPLGNMWIGTQGGGLNRYDPRTKTMTSFSEENGLANNSVNYITGDQSGKIWVSTNHGFGWFDPVKNIFRDFGKSNNLRTLEFNLGAGERLSTGEIVMGSINGFNIVDPANLSFNKNRPGVVLTSFEVNNRPLIPGAKKSPLTQSLLTTKEITLKQSQSAFTIVFAALDYTAPANNKYAYMLEGFDSDWNFVGNERRASYTNLNPGQYTFKVKASNNDGVWNERETVLTIHIIAPFWMTWWFKNAIILALAGVAYFFYYYRLNFVRKQKVKLELLVRRRTGKIKDQAAHLENLNRELLDKTSSLEQLNHALKKQKNQEHEARLIAEQAQKQADAANSAKSTFLATMSHELRTPINGVMGMASLLAETSLNNEQTEYTEAILTSGESLLNVINDVLDFSRIESGNIELLPHEFELRKCVEDVMELFGPRIAESGIDLIYLIDDQLPEMVIADSVRLRQILINMVGNAVKFTHHGEVFLNVSMTTAANETPRLQFQIRDTGIGIPESQHQNLFKAFNQLDSSVTRKYGGSGLGLVICERLVKLMGGHIEVESSFGHGTTFTFDIQFEQNEVSKPTNKELVNNHLGNNQILIVDDNSRSLLALTSQLSGLDLQIKTASSGAEALIFLKEQPATRLVIADMHMPQFDGIQLAKAIGEINHDISLILLGPIRDVNKKQYQSLFHAVLNKPVRQEALVRAVGEVLKSMRSPSQDIKKSQLSTDFALQYPYRILVAEDIPINQKLITWILNKLGYQPELANNGLEVLEIMKAKPCDVILMDLQMPEMDGLEATRIIRQTYGAKPAIIALTANALSEDRDNCLKAGMNDYITKPINLELLTKSLINLHNLIVSG